MILGLKRLSTARLQSRLSAWLERSLANRIVLRSQLIAFAVLLVSGLIYYPITVSYVQEASALKLHLVATRFAQKLEAKVGLLTACRPAPFIQVHQHRSFEAISHKGDTRCQSCSGCALHPRSR